jgi:hypothetical protein
MGRTAEPGLSYYRMNCGHTLNKKVRLLFNEFGSDGYWIWQCILDEAYKHNGYFFNCNDKDELSLFATDVCKKQVTLVDEVITGCLRRGLFDKAVFELFGVLTSVMMQEIYLEATRERRKKGTIISLHEDFLLIKIAATEGNISIVPGKKEILPGKKTIDPGNNPKSKVKERKGKESSSAAPATQPAAGKNTEVRKRKEEEPPEPYWQHLVEAWFKFHADHFGPERPLFDGQDPKLFKKIVERLKKRAGQRQKEWTQENALASLNFFLTIAFSDDWTSKHFSLKVLYEKFEEIYKRHQLDTTRKKGGPMATMDIQYLYERYCDGQLDVRVITVGHYQQLAAKGLVNITNGVVQKRIKSLLGSNNYSEGQLCQDYQAGNETPAVVADRPALMKLSVVEYFKTKKEANASEIL